MVLARKKSKKYRIPSFFAVFEIDSFRPIPPSANLKGHGNEAGFLGFFQKLVPLHYLSCRSAFGFEFVEIYIIEKGLPDSASRRLAMVSRGVVIQIF